jgi:hypothetical protein
MDFDISVKEEVRNYLIYQTCQLHNCPMFQWPRLHIPFGTVKPHKPTTFDVLGHRDCDLVTNVKEFRIRT